MHIKLSTSQVAEKLYHGDGGFSWGGANALAEYLDELEDGLGEPVEFDKVAIRCSFSEYASAEEAAEDLGWDADDDTSALEWLENKTTVIAFDRGVIVQLC